MVVSEQGRRRLHARLVETLGAEEADALMAHLPPTGWAELATRQDVEALRVATRQDLEVLESRLEAEMADRFAAMTRTIMTGMVALVIAVIGSMTGAVVTLAR
jgi:DNA-binding IclR family transcriptional regulator